MQLRGGVYLADCGDLGVHRVRRAHPAVYKLNDGEKIVGAMSLDERAIGTITGKKKAPNPPCTPWRQRATALHENGTSRRGLCPSCDGRRMAERAAHLIDHVIPDVPVRQWVLSLPHRLRYRLAWDHDLCRRVIAVLLRAVFRLLRAHARAAGLEQTHVLFDPVEFLGRLAVLVPRPRVKLILYYGVLGARAAWRPEVVPRPPLGQDPAIDDRVDEACTAAAPDTTQRQARGQRWAVLMRRAFGFDVLACPRCGGRLRLIALIEEAAVIDRILRHLGLPADLPAACPARAPPLLAEAGEPQADEYESGRRCVRAAFGRPRQLDTAAAGAIIGAFGEREAPVGQW